MANMTFGVNLIPNNNTQQRTLGNDQNKWDINANTINATTINGNTATTSTAGLMSVADKTKLDGIEAGAEVNPDIANNLTETTTGKVLDATQGKILKDAIDNLDAEINSLDAEDVGAIKDDYNYTYMGSPYTGNELILLHNTTTGVNNVTDVASFLSSAGGGSGSNQGALVHYTKKISLNATAGTQAQSFSDSNITENMVVLQAEIDDPSAQTNDWIFTTANGMITLNGTVNAATNVTLYFGVQMSAVPSIQVNLASTSADNILKANPQPGVMGALGVPNGGTGATTPAGACANIGAVKKSGDTMTGQLNLSQSGGSEGGQIRLAASPDHPEYAGINIDQVGPSRLRIFGEPSADGTSFTGTGTDLSINPYEKTITGGYTFTGNVIGTASGNVAKSGDTMTGALTINDANTTPNQYAEIAKFKRPAMRDNDNVMLYLGKAFSTKNCGTILYHHAGDGSNSNYLALSAYNAAQSLRSYADGHIELSQPLGVPYGGTGATTPGSTLLSNLGLKVIELTLNFSNGLVSYTFSRDVYVVGCCGVATQDIYAVARVSGHTGFKIINVTDKTFTGSKNVEICYIEK